MFNFVTDGYSYQLIMLVYKKYHGIGHTLHLIDAIAHPRVRGLTRLTKGGGAVATHLTVQTGLTPFSCCWLVVCQLVFSLSKSSPSVGHACVVRVISEGGKGWRQPLGLVLSRGLSG